MTLKGPYLRLQDDHPVSWVVIDVTEGQTPRFYEKGLEEEAKYQAFQINENEMIQAIIPTTQQQLMWAQLDKKYYEIRKTNLVNHFSILENCDKRLAGKNVPQKLYGAQFEEINYVPNNTEEEYYQRPQENLEQELKEALKPQNEISESSDCIDYSLNALTQDIELTTTQSALLKKLEEHWFFPNIDKESIPDACRMIFCLTPDNQKAELESGNSIRIFREKFFWPKNIANDFKLEKDVRISDLIDFTYLLVNKVYILHTHGQELVKPKLPSLANQTVGQFLKTLEENPEEVLPIDLNDEDLALQQGIFDSIELQHTVPDEQQPIEQQGIFQNSENRGALEEKINDDLYPSTQLSFIARWCEWICHLCRILDVYCLKMSNVGKEISKHHALSENQKSEYNQKFFSSRGDFDDNIRDLYISKLWKGRSRT